MYLKFYGLKEMPFALTPDPRFIYFTPSHIEAMANLRYGIESGKGLIVVTGEVGTGKTTILRWMMKRFDRMVLVAYIFNPRLSVPEFYQHLTALLGVEEWQSKSDLLLLLGRNLESRHARGLRTVLIIDEAQGLSPNVLEEVRLLSNFETDTVKQLQIVLTGQPELRGVLNNPALRQLKQRIALRCEIAPLPDVEQTERYILSRLLVAGAERTDIFTPAAIDLIYRCSEGIPRQINNLCDNSLLNGYAASAATIGKEIVEQVAETFDMLPRNKTTVRRNDERQPAAVPAESQQLAPIFSETGESASAEIWAGGGGEARGRGHRGNGGNGVGATATTTTTATAVAALHGADERVGEA